MKVVKNTLLTGVIGGIATLCTFSIISDNNDDNAKNKIQKDTTISAEQYDNFSKRVESGKKTWSLLSDSIDNAHKAKADSIAKNYNAKVDSVKMDIIKKYHMPAKKFKALEEEAGSNLSEWEKISNLLKNKVFNDTLKAQQMYKLQNKIAKGVKKIRH